MYVSYQHLLRMATTAVHVEAGEMVTRRVGIIGQEVTHRNILCVGELVNDADGAPGAKVSTLMENGVSKQNRHS